MSCIKPMACVVLLICGACSHLNNQTVDPNNALVDLACKREVVVLGENTHGDGQTVSIKAEIVQRLVDECGFSAIVFESSFYDFEELAFRTPDNRPYDRKLFLSAIGGLWSNTAEFAPLADWIATQTPDDLKIGGMDPQLGSAGAFYSIDAMPRELVAVLPEDLRAQCRSDMMGWIAWTADRSAAKPRIEVCLAKIELHLASTKDRSRRLIRYVDAFRKALTWTNLDFERQQNARDQAMAEQFMAFRDRLDGHDRIIIWTANAHAAYGGFEDRRTVVQILREEMGDSLFTVGFSAAGGFFREIGSGEVRGVTAAGPEQLEGIVLQNKSRAVADSFFLKSLGKISGSALVDHKSFELDWADIYDAIYIIDYERPTTPADLKLNPKMS